MLFVGAPTGLDEESGWPTSVGAERLLTRTGSVISVRGEIDMATAPQRRGWAKKPSKVYLSAHALDCRDSRFSTLREWRAGRCAHRLGEDARSCSTRPSARRKVLEITGVASHLSVIP
jgi:hypothetical protein